jgi:uncharacterized protein
VFDTNALISAFLIKNSTSDLAFRKSMTLGKLAISDSLMSEFLEVLWRPKFDKYFSSDERANVVDQIERYSIPFVTIEEIGECEDPDDNRILELAIASNATLIISGDPHLLKLNPFRKIPIISASDFLKSL